MGRTRDEEDWAVEAAHAELLKRVCDREDVAVAPEDVVVVDHGARVPAGRVLAMPLFADSETVGALYLERGAGRAWFSREETELASAASAQIPLALELARTLADRDRVHARLRRAQNMEAVGDLAEHLAGEFEEVLASVDRALAKLEDDAVQLGEGGRYAADVIAESSRRAARLHNELVAFSRRKDVEPSVIDARRTVRDLVPMIRQLVGSEITIEVRCDDGPIWVEADQASLEDALVSLIVNARDAMQAGGKVVVALGKRSVDDAATAQIESRVRIAVEDTGCGIPSEALEKIFEPFYTTKEAAGARGLGLSSAYGFVRRCGGYIDVQSAVGIGSTFSIDLPAGRLG
jgi:signal transduction histidine kinase